MRIHCHLMALMLLLTSAETGRGETWYVNNQLGNDRATGLSAEPQAEHGPLKTIDVALILAKRGDRIVLANTGTPYREMISLMGPHHSGFPDAPFVIEGNGATLDGTVEAAPGAWRNVKDNVFAMRPRRLTYQQLFSDGKPLTRSLIYAKYDAAQLEPLHWALFDGLIYFRTEGNGIPDEYNLRHAGLQTGVTLYNVEHVRVENLIVQGFQQDGINAHELVRHCELTDIDCRANGRSGISVGGVSRVEVVRGNFYDNGRVQVRTEGFGELELVDCDVATNGAAPAFQADGRKLIANGELVTE